MLDDTPPVFIPEPPDLTKQRRLRQVAMVKRLKRCVWPLCEGKPYLQIDSPLCVDHGLILQERYQQVAKSAADAVEAFIKPKKPRDPAAIGGQVYFIRLNDVIKIGWTSQLHVRLRDYTVGAELLAHHPGTRADERDLHRSFKPLLVHGREWYQGDAKILLDHITAVVAEHGEPRVDFLRTTSSAHRGAQIRSRTKRNRLGSWAP